MLIDFHTHTFPDNIALKTISFLKQKALMQSGFDLKPNTDGTVDGLLSLMDKQNVDISVVLPIATKTSQIDTIIESSAKIRNERLISFATIHPENKNKFEMLKTIKDMGFLGIKLHPDYQRSYIDSDENIEILKICEQLGLYTVIHAGVDIGFPKPYYSMPDRILNVLKYVSGKYLIGAHLGGFFAWDDVEKYLVGTDMYFDTSMIAGYIEKNQLERIIKNHGSEKILFGSDAPWNSPEKTEKMIDMLELEQTEIQNIKWRNAAGILGIELDII